ncbi:MAG: isopeptide-forming domain-containing fimbrial protein [Pyrinomonadaceae bacterium]
MKRVLTTKNLLIFIHAILILSFTHTKVFSQSVATPANTTISNFAKGVYEDDRGVSYETISSTVSIDVKVVSSLVVTPNQTSPTETVAPNETLVREFEVCNTSNNSDSYTVTGASVTAPAGITDIFYDLDDNGEISAGDIRVELNQPLSNIVSPGSCIKILVRLNTNDIATSEQLRIDLTVRSNNTDAVNGQAQDTGRIINSGGKAAVFTNPADPALIPRKLVQDRSSYVSGKGEQLTYEISFRNSGDVDARNVVINDELPAELNYIPNTLKLETKALTDAADGDEGEVSGKTLTVRLSRPVKPNEVVSISLKATVSQNVIPGRGVVNVATITADNAKTATTSEAIAVVDPFGTVYAARGGAGSPIPGATVTILTDSTSGSILPIPQGQGFEPNFKNLNPYVTDNRGRFSFGLLPSQLGTESQPARYVVSVSAENFRPRLLEITLRPDGNGLFRMTVRSLDGLPIAVADGFELTVNDVEIPSIADVAFNIPLFEEATLEVSKTADRAQAEVGDIANYRIEVRNSSVAPLLNVRVKDTLPDSFTYVEDTARITRGSAASPIKPVINGNVMEFGIGDLLSGEGVSIQYRVRIGVNARRGDNFNSAVVSGTFPSGEENVSEPSRALVKVSPGLFSMRQFVIGRVFVDKNNNGVFDYGERPVAGARIYLSNGNSATTDTQGLYSVPAVSEGAQVIAIDPITIPKGYVLSNGGRRSGKDWTRLLRTPLGGGAMLRQNFALLSDGTVKDDQDEIVKTALDKPADKKPVSVLPAESSDQNEYKAVAPGEVFVHRLENGSVAPKTSVNIDVSVAEGWSARIEAGQAKFGTENIGTTRNDPANKITTFTFVGIGLKPGPNKIRAFPVSPEGISGKPLEIEIFGRGAASRLKVAAEHSELQASGRDSTTIVVEAYDEWGHPAQDGSVIVRTSSGRFFDPTKSEEENEDASEGSVMREDLFATNGSTSEQENGSLREQKIELVNGIGIVKLISDNKTGTARVTAIQGKAEGYSDIRFTSETRPGFLAGLAEVTIGKNAPEMANRETDENVRGRIQFFYKGKFFSDKNNLTVAYDSQEPLNRVSGQDRLFQLNPVDQVYPLFGDSSTRFQETESNSKVYARIDRGRSYAMFGDFDAGLDSNRLLGFSRRLTGAKVHVENRNGDFVTVTGARPDTAFARQVIAGGSLGLIQLNYADVLPGSEVLMIETRDRRNPELILSREVLSRSVDYNIDTTTGTIFFLRSIPTFDRDLNLIQIVATYEYRSEGFESSVYTARGAKTFNRLGLRLGFSYVNQRQDEESPFQLGGIDGSLKLPNRGRLDFEWATSRGPLNHGYSFFGNSQSGDREFNGNAFFVSLEQPLSYGQTVLRFEGFSASGNFYNPFGATVTAGSTRGALSIESKPLKNGTVKVNLVAEKNHTENVDNNRITAGIQWSQLVNEKLKFNFGYDFRRYSDNDADRSVLSNLITVGAEYKPTSKLDFSIKREQNLGAEDPSYPNQTLIGANYQLNQFAKVFFTQRLASNPITPISDVSGTGFASSNARYETAVGVETQFGKYTSLSGRYQLENGLNGTDSFSIIGLKNRIPVSEKLSLEAGYERAFHLAGEGKSYNNFTLGANWLPDENFRSSFRYELRDREGFGHLFSLGAAGKLRPGWTTLGRLQYGDVNYNGRKNFAMNGQLALAIRPHNTDKYGLLLSYKHRENFFSGGTEDTQNELRDDIFSVDGFHQTTRRLELYGRFAAKFSADQTPDIPFASNLSYLAQARAQYLLSDSFDVAIEGRYMYQPTTGSQNRWLGIEAGYWVTPEMRIGGGYNFKQSTEVFGFNNDQVYNKGGFYFSITTKLSRLFDLFGTSDKGLEHTLPGGKYPQSAKNEDRKDK